MVLLSGMVWMDGLDGLDGECYPSGLEQGMAIRREDVNFTRVGTQGNSKYTLGVRVSEGGKGFRLTLLLVWSCFVRLQWSLVVISSRLILSIRVRCIHPSIHHMS